MRRQDIYLALALSYMLLLFITLILHMLRNVLLMAVPDVMARTGTYIMLLLLTIATWSLVTYRMFRGIERRALKDFQTQEDLREHEKVVKERQSHT